MGSLGLNPLFIIRRPDSSILLPQHLYIRNRGCSTKILFLRSREHTGVYNYLKLVEFQRRSDPSYEPVISIWMGTDRTNRRVRLECLYTAPCLTVPYLSQERSNGHSQHSILIMKPYISRLLFFTKVVKMPYLGSSVLRTTDQV